MQIGLHFFALALIGCATTNGPPALQDKPVPVSCVMAIPTRPALEAEAAWVNGDEFERVQALKKDRRLLLLHVGALEATLEACKK